MINILYFYKPVKFNKTLEIGNLVPLEAYQPNT